MAKNSVDGRQLLAKVWQDGRQEGLKQCSARAKASIIGALCVAAIKIKSVSCRSCLPCLLHARQQLVLRTKATCCESCVQGHPCRVQPQVFLPTGSEPCLQRGLLLQYGWPRAEIEA